MFQVNSLSGLFHQLIAGLAASLSAMSTAAIYGWLTPILPRLITPESEIVMTLDDASWLLTIPMIGRILSPLPSGYLADRFGRKPVIMFSGITYLIGWTTTLYFKTLLALYIANFIHGIGTGIVTAVLPTYLGEIASPQFRGVVMSTYFNMWWFGYLFEFIVGPNVSFMNFSYVTASINLVFLLAFVWQPETPYFYVMNNNLCKARESLSWFTSKSEEEMNKELCRMALSAEEIRKNKVKWTDLFVDPINRKCMIILLLTSSVRLVCGINSLASYSTETLTEEGDYFFLSPDDVTIAMGVMMCVGSLFSSFVLDIVGRTYLFFVSCLISGFCMTVVGTFYLVKTQTSLDTTSFGWIPPTGIILFSATSVMGIFSVAIGYQSELFDTSTRSTASSISVVLSAFTSLISYKVYQPIAEVFGAFVNFYSFAVVCFFGVFITFTLVPETKGKSFEEIRDELQNRKMPEVLTSRL